LGVTGQLMMENGTVRNNSLMYQYYKNEKQLTVGNYSKNAVSWICGPKHEIRDQRIPGYTGFIPGIQAENVYSKSYTRCAAKSLNGRIDRQNELSPERRFKTQH